MAQITASHSRTINQSRPLILREGVHTLEELAWLKNSAKIWEVSDIYEYQLKELFEIRHPEHKMPGFSNFAAYEVRKQTFIKERRQAKKGFFSGNWIYFPWNGRLVHSVTENDYFLLRTNRNRNLISEEEQKKLYEATVGILGLSVGSHVVSALAYGGIANSLKLAEFDTLDTTNLNRLSGRIDQIGQSKIQLTAQKVYEANPYTDLNLYEDGLTKKTLEDFIFKNPRPDIIVEIIDSFEMKILLREKARKAKIPVIMVANLGDSVLIDIERYDINPDLPYFNGETGDIPNEILHNPDETDEDKNYYAVELVGRNNIPEEAMISVKEIGKTLVGRPQLMSTVAVSAGLITFVIKNILLRKSDFSGRKLIRFDTFFHD